MHAVALAAGQLADFLLLVGAFEIECRAIGPRIHFALAKRQLIEAAGDFFPYALGAIERIARLIDITEPHRFTDLDGALIGLFLLGDHAKQCGLAGAVRPDDADNAAGRQFESEIVDEQIVAEAFLEMLEVDDVLTEPFRDWNDDLRSLRLLVAGVRWRASSSRPSCSRRFCF